MDLKEIRSSRLLLYPAEKVFTAFSQPKHLERWWGPKDFRNTFRSFEFKPGGQWHFTMHGPNGRDYPNESEFLEITKPEKISLRHLSPPEFQLNITLHRVEDKTRIIWSMIFATETQRNTVATYAIEANEQNFDRLEAELARMP